jgi:hypothetical protein
MKKQSSHSIDRGSSRRRVILQRIAKISALVGVVVLGLLPARVSRAQDVQITFAGNYDTGNQTEYGTRGSAVSFSYSILYDTSVGPSYVHAVGDSLGGGYTAGDPMYGFPVAGIVSTGLTVGSGADAFTFAIPATVQMGSPSFLDADPAALWFNTNIDDLTTPTAGTFNLLSEPGDQINQLIVGAFVASGPSPGPVVFLNDGGFLAEGDNEAPVTLESITLTPVPEPTTAALLSMSLFALLRRRPRNKMSPECAAV